MKASGFIELVIIVAALVMGLPLFLACNKMANMDVNTIYMNDKSTWQIAADIEWELNENGVLIPTNVIEPITLSPAQAAVMGYVQDEYTPNSARTIDFNYNAKTLDDETINETMSTSSDVREAFVGVEEFTFTSLPFSRVSNEISYTVHRKVTPMSNIEKLKDEKLYFVYNTKRKSWMITSKYIYIYTID